MDTLKKCTAAFLLGVLVVIAITGLVVTVAHSCS